MLPRAEQKFTRMPTLFDMLQTSLPTYNSVTQGPTQEKRSVLIE